MTGCISSLLAGRSLSGPAFRRGLRVLGVGLLLSLLASPAFAAKLTYQVKGLKGENKDNVEAYLNALPVYQERQYR
ncbi:MAG: autotransporter assembly complex protein TamA, partial [Aeromonadaceae bacterium]